MFIAIQAIDAEGWLHTGDLATMDENGYFKNIGRMTASGKIQKYKLREMAIEELGLQDAATIETA